MAAVARQRGDAIGVRLIATLVKTAERQIEALRRAGAQMRESRRRPTDDGYPPAVLTTRTRPTDLRSPIPIKAIRLTEAPG